MEFGDAKIGKETQKPLAEHDESNVSMDWQTNTEGHGDQLMCPLTTSSAAGNTDSRKEEDDTLPEEKKYQKSNDDDTEVIYEREPKETEERTKVYTAGIASSEKCKNGNKVIEDSKGEDILKIESDAEAEKKKGVLGKRTKAPLKKRDIKKTKTKSEKMQPSGIYRINPEKYEEMVKFILGEGKDEDYKEREIKTQPEGRFKLKWFCQLYFEKESPLIPAIQSLAEVGDIDMNRTSRHILIFYEEENSSEQGNKPKEMKNVFARCFGHAQNVIRNFVDQEFSFDIGRRQVDMEKLLHYSHTFLLGPIHSLVVKLQREGNPIRICPYYIINSITGKMEINLKGLTNEKQKANTCKVQISESNLKVFKPLTILQHSHLLSYLLACSDEVPKYDYQYNFMSREKDAVVLERLEKHIEARIQLMIDGTDSADNPVKEVVVMLNGGDLETLSETVYLEIKRKPKNANVEISNPPQIQEIEEILYGIEEKNFSPKDLYLKYELNREKLLDCIKCHVFMEDKTYFKEGKRWYKAEGDFMKQIRWDFQDLMDELLMSEDDENFLPLPCLENIKMDAKGDNKKEQNILQKMDVKLACSEFLKLITADALKGKKVEQVMDQLSPQIEWVFPYFKDGETDRVIMKLDSNSKKEIKDVLGQKEFDLFLKCFTAIKKEEEYNRMYIDLQMLVPDLGYIVGDTIEIRKIELFDILKIPKEKSGGELHLYHVKRNLDVSSVRAVVSQIKNSAEFLQRCLNEDKLKLKQYYEFLVNPKNKSKFRDDVRNIVRGLLPTAEEFQKLFEKNTIVFVYAFTDHLLSRTMSCNRVSQLGCKANRKLQSIDLTMMAEEIEALVEGGYLVKSGSKHDINESTFKCKEARNEKHFKSVLQNHGEARLKEILKFFEDSLCPLHLDSTGSCIDLLSLKSIFQQNYPEFKLKICQIKRPWYWADIKDHQDPNISQDTSTAMPQPLQSSSASSDPNTDFDFSDELQKYDSGARTSEMDLETDSGQKYDSGSRTSELDLETDSGQGSMETDSDNKGSKRGSSPTGEHCKKIKADDSPEDN